MFNNEEEGKAKIIHLANSVGLEGNVNEIKFGTLISTEAKKNINEHYSKVFQYAINCSNCYLFIWAYRNKQWIFIKDSFPTFTDFPEGTK